MNATLRRRRNPAIAVPKSATSPVIVPILAQVREQPVDLVVVVLVLAATAVVVEAGRSAINAARSGTLLVIAPRMAGVEEDTKLREAMAVEEVAMEVAMEVVVHVKVVKPVTHAAVTVTCLAIALKARSATTVSRASFRKIWESDISLPSITLANRTLGGEVGHLSRDCPSEASTERVCYKCKQPGHIQAVCVN